MSGERRSALTLVVVLAPPLLALLVYLGGYVWLRGTHELVRLGHGVMITGDDRTIWLDVYAPAIAIETRVSDWIDPPPPVLPTSYMDGS